MSETGVLSQEYQNMADLFRDINRSVIVIKKLHFNLSGASQITDEELAGARGMLTSVLRRLIEIFRSHSPAQGAGDDDALQLPPFFLKRLHELHSAEMQWYVDDLSEVMKAVEGERPLTGDLIAHLDELCGQLDAETTAIHRRLWRK